MIFVGIDNGVSGSMGAVTENGELRVYTPTPVISCLNYTKKKAWITRVDHKALGLWLEGLDGVMMCAVERPMINPGRFKATVSAIRALESTQIVLENLELPFIFVDSREWQKVMLPSGLHKEELKTASNQICKRLFPKVDLKKPGDGDSLLIAEWLRRTHKKDSEEVV